MTQSENTKNNYLVRVNKVLSYIQNNLEKPFQLSELASVGSFSQFHFHRIITAHLNESIGRYIKRIRLEKAAQLLQFSKKSITEISISIGYETLSSFSEAFNKQFSISPSSYRVKHTKLNLIKKLDVPLKINFDFQPEIKSLPVQKIAYVRVFGKYDTKSIGKSWDTLLKFASKNKLLNEKTQLFGISYDNPEIAENSNYQYNACISIEKEIKPQGEIGIKEINGGVYAIFTYKGNHNNFAAIYKLIFKEWLLKSKYELRDTVIFDRYINTPIDTEPNELITQIHIPVK